MACSFDLKLAPDVGNRAFLGAGNARQQFRHKQPEISEPIRGCSQDDNSDRKCWKVLLKGKIPIDGDV